MTPKTQSVCAHLTLKYLTEPVGNGAVTGYWQCKDCPTKFEPVAEPASTGEPPRYTNRHGERCSDACGQGRHTECVEVWPACNCTYRGLHKTMHRYATINPAARPSGPYAPGPKDAVSDQYGFGTTPERPAPQTSAEYLKKCIKEGPDCDCVTVCKFDAAPQPVSGDALEPWPMIWAVRGIHGSNSAYFNREAAERHIADRAEPHKFTIFEYIPKLAGCAPSYMTCTECGMKVCDHIVKRLAEDAPRKDPAVAIADILWHESKAMVKNCSLWENCFDRANAMLEMPVSYERGDATKVAERTGCPEGKVEEIARGLMTWLHHYDLSSLDSERLAEIESMLIDRLRPYFPPASQTPDFKTLDAAISDLGELAEMLRDPQHEPTGFDCSIALRLEQITQTLKSIEPAATPASTARTDGWVSNHKLDTETHVYFYEQEFYVLSNFSSFRLFWRGMDFDTSEAAYHYEKFPNHPAIQEAIKNARSAHEAFKIAERHKSERRPDWDAVKIEIMRDVLRCKVNQHEYARRKLLQTGTRLLVEDSWRDSFWGWGEDGEGQNVLGQLWMEIRRELPAAPGSVPPYDPEKDFRDKFIGNWDGVPQAEPPNPNETSFPANVQAEPPK